MGAECVGVDVGGHRKGFHLCAVAGAELTAPPFRLRTVAEAVAWIADRAPRVVALDCPLACAEPGERSRAGERALARAVCGIRWTPERADLAGDPYYEWVEHGLELGEALGAAGLEPIEVFPTASWTRWAGERGGRSRAEWSSAALGALPLRGLPAHHSQDDRDAIAAALTARLYIERQTEDFGGIYVPAGPFG